MVPHGGGGVRGASVRNPRRLGAACLLALATAATAQGYGNGSDGALAPLVDVTLDTTQNGGVFQFTSIAVPAGVTVHLVGGNPATLLCQGSVAIAGRIEADGKGSVWANGMQQNGQSGGPGGHAGGTNGNGFGPGGGAYGQGLYPAIAGGSASHATAGATNNPFLLPAPTYGSALPFDLRGGSGGGAPGSGNANSYGPPASGGGGTIVILAGGQVLVSGTVSARGGDIEMGPEYAWPNARPGTGGCGSGGSILLRSLQCVHIQGTVDATGGAKRTGAVPWSPSGGDGFVRIDSYTACGAPNLSGATIRPAPVVAAMPFLLALEPARIGRVYRVRCASAPGDVVGLYWSLGWHLTPVPPFGVLQLDPGLILFLGQHAVPVARPDPLAAVDIAVPGDPSLVGITVYSQMFNAFGAVTGNARLSNLLVTTIGS